VASLRHTELTGYVVEAVHSIGESSVIPVKEQEPAGFWR